MILAAPLVIPFAEAIGLSVATLGIAKASDMVNEYIQENPEQSMKIFQMIMPSQGIANILKNKSSDEEVEEDVEVEEVDTRDLTRAEKAKMMKELAKSGGGNMREKMKKGYEEIIQPGESDRELDDAEDRYDGGVEDAPKPKFDYKKFFKKRYADGGAIGIEVLFEPKVPAAPSQLVKESEIVLGYRGPGGYQGGRSSSGSSRSSRSSGPAGGASAGGNYGGNRNPGQTYGGSMFSGGSGGVRTGTGSSGAAGGATRKTTPTFSKTPNYRLRALEFAKKYNPLSLLFGTDVAAAEIDFSKLPQATDPFSPKANMVTGPKVSQFEKQFPNATKKDFVDAVQSGFFGPGGTQVFEKNVSNLFEGVNLDKGGFSFGDVTPTLIGTKDGSFKQAIDIDKEALDSDALKDLPGGFFKADGGRVGLFMGGSPLEGQALNIYNSMNAYGFQDQEIADALSAQGLYTAPGSSTPETTPGNTIGYQGGGGGGGDNFSVYNPDPNSIRSIKQDPAIQSNLEAIQRNQQLQSMGINDPFANEQDPANAYYGDMFEDTSNQIGKQSMFAKAKQGLSGIVGNVKGLMDNPIGNAIGFAINPIMGGIKGIASFANRMLPANERAIQENIMGNMGFAVNDIGQIVSTGDYNDPENVMAGYNLSRMTPETFMKRIASIKNRKAAQTDASRRRIAAIQEAQRKFEAAEKLKRLAVEEANLRKGRAPGGGRFDGGQAAYTNPDTGVGGGQFTDSLGNQDYQDAYDPGGGEKDGGIIGYQNGGLVTMFKEKR